MNASLPEASDDEETRPAKMGREETLELADEWDDLDRIRCEALRED